MVEAVGAGAGGGVSEGVVVVVEEGVVDGAVEPEEVVAEDCGELLGECEESES